MLLLGLLVVFCCGFTTRAEVTDFDDRAQGYEFIYHDSYDLIVMKTRDRCFFVHFPDDREEELVNDQHHYYYHQNTALQDTENSLLHHVWYNVSGDVRESSLTAVRNKYHDLLADYQCSDKRIYEMSFPSPHSSSSNTGHHHSTGGSGTGSHYQGSGSGGSQQHGFGGSDVSCNHLSTGMHPYPPDCHQFLMCNTGMSFVMPCPDGTAYSASAPGCVLVPDSDCSSHG